MEASENCSVKVALHIRPLIGDERIQGCKECVSVTPGKPQIRIGAHSFTFDHVYGSRGAPSSAMFEECISPLIDGLFQGYNATVLAYGQTGSGKTYTMGTGSGDGCQTGLIPKVMNALFSKIDILKHQTEFQLQVSFIEILKEEVRDLLDSVSLSKLDAANGHAAKMNTHGRHLVQIRETSNGAITLAGLTEVAVSSSQEMTACLAQGSLSRATASTNMNNQSSRSHAIFTITLEQLRKIHSNFAGNDTPDEDMGEEYFCAKFHLVDLAGSERAKRTGTDGLRLKEGIHINKGLLALGNVISALGDDKKRKEGMHVPYRDSKLTRLLQDSLGGNSKTVMIACISPADINAEESLNTLKYANRARNIQNKPIVNRDVISNEMQKMQEQLKLLQAELCTRGGGAQFNEVPVLKERIAWLEARNEELCRELHRYRRRCAVMQPCETDVQEGDACFTKSDGLKRGFQSIDSSDYQMGEISSGENSGEIDEVTKEWEHQRLQNSLDMELNDLNKRLEQKESEMRIYGGVDTVALKQHFGKKIMELETEKRIVQQERDRLLAEVESLASSNSDGQGQKLKDVHAQKLKTLETQISDLKKKQENQVQLLREKQKSDDAAKRLQAEIQYIKSQKVQLQHRIKQESEKFRQWKASREKELLQLRKEGRRNEFERHKLEALNQRQKLVLQRKAEEATNATKRLKQLLEARKSVIRDNSANSNGHTPANSNGHTSASQGNERSLQRWLDHELEVLVHVYEVRHEYEKQQQLRAAVEKELAMFKQANHLSSEKHGPQIGKSGHSRVLSMSMDARRARIASLENMLSMSSNALMVMATQLSEAEERERSLSGRGRWNQVRSMGDAKNLLQYIFNSAAETRCQLWEKKMEIKDMEDQLNELVNLLRKSEAQRKELVKEQMLREQAVAAALSTPASGNPRSSLKHFADDISGPLSPISLPAPKQLKFTAGIVSSSVQESASFLNQTRKQLVPAGQLSMKKLATMGQAGKLRRWKRSHHQWLIQFKWKWQKPWKLSEWIKHSDETLIRSRPRLQAQINMIR
ncbi:PREDICTED: chromosome-associated kinesin KIF4A-like [Fragaria vesca subsp. vesca]|uniref:chromosome-associated kinesin KIF4A-like n=1 Tax=Fragaria vesca subsp. vesca TaxID=101020 RepID=UPI0002C3525E|nr:PREDICTED: chromosome-associated kinesin KIF4A-like [Fragaria vesca subsp. vesca]XP_011463886.1 PREDICTED: chromosome-associated kinesin KIF4A-like [Fragaria vesca subsp. vesca]